MSGRQRWRTTPPVEMLRRAERLHTAAGEVARGHDGDPVFAAWSDQVAAAGGEVLQGLHDVEPELQRLIGGDGLVELEANPRRLAFLMALLTQAQQRGVFTRCCPHVRDFAHPRPVALLLTVGVGACGECMPRLLARYAHEWRDDGLCEVCGRPAGTFRPSIVAVAHWTATVEVCGRCYRWAADDTGGGS